MLPKHVTKTKESRTQRKHCDQQEISLAEGVETVEQFERLKELGCHLFQGYYFSKSIPVAEFERLLEKR